MSVLSVAWCEGDGMEMTIYTSGNTNCREFEKQNQDQNRECELSGSHEFKEFLKLPSRLPSLSSLLDPAI
jgi:hypothetical protein